MSLVTVKDIAKNTGLHKLGLLGQPLAWSLHRLLHLNILNKVYLKNKELESPAFESAVLDDVGVHFEISPQDLDRIPKQGPFIIVANHPLGGIDGLLLLKIISEIRPDFKIIGNFLLQKIRPLESRVFAVNPFETRQDIKNSTGGMLAAFKHLKKGGALGIFPAGEVSARTSTQTIEDKPWQLPVLKLIQKAGVPIIPIYFKTKNSELFYQLAKIHPDVQTAMLARETLRTRLKPVRIRIGKVVTLKQQEEFKTPQELGKFLRKKTYLLSESFDDPTLPQKIKKSIPKKKTFQKTIIAETDKAKILQEIHQLKEKEALLFSNNRYDCFFYMYNDAPNIMREIGRLREYTFRQVGEGTNNSSDLDRYDKHYHHLLLWDNEDKKIAGAYRMGLGKKIYERYGMKGFYINELFNFEPELQPFFAKSIEMGRAFVSPEYQQKPFPLFLLWRGIIHVALRHPEYKYIIGGVSISNQFSEFSKALMIEFMRSHFYDPYVAQYVRPKKAFKPKLKDQDKDFIFDEANADLNKFDKLIEELEPGGLRLPVLIKKYIKQNARLIAFNVDPKFNDALDGLMYIRIQEIPESTIKPVLEELSKINNNTNP